MCINRDWPKTHKNNCTHFTCFYDHLYPMDFRPGGGLYNSKCECQEDKWTQWTDDGVCQMERSQSRIPSRASQSLESLKTRYSHTHTHKQEQQQQKPLLNVKMWLIFSITCMYQCCLLISRSHVFQKKFYWHPADTLPGDVELPYDLPILHLVT